MDKINVAKKIEFFETLKTKRTKWDGIWTDIKKYVVPTDPKNEILDSTARWAREQLASGLQSLLVNQSSNWFSISVSNKDIQDEGADTSDINEDPTVAKWNSDTGQRLLDIFHNVNSNFYSQIHEFFLTLTAFGSSVFYIEEDPTISSGIFFRNIDINECYFEDNKFGLVDRMYRKFSLTVRAAHQKFPEVKEFKEKLKKDPDEEIEILHVVEEVFEDSKNRQFKYTSDYIDLENQKILLSSGYDYFPFLVCRWIKETDAYGYSPANHVLPDIKVLNVLRKMSLESGQKQLRPPMIAPKDGYRYPLKLGAGEINIYRTGTMDKIIPLIDVGNKMSTLDEEQQCKDAILKAFFIDIFRMQKEDKEMTATEVSYRTEEQMRMMSPIVGRIETEFLNPLLMAVYNITSKYGIIPTLEIQGSGAADIEIEYISPLSRSQKSASISSIEQVLGFFQRTGITNIYPEIYDNIDFDEVFRMSFKLRGAPSSVLKDEKEVITIRSRRAEAQEQQAMMQMQANGQQVE